MDFNATTFGSLTQCKEATSLCDMEYSTMGSSDGLCSFDCKRDRAGFDLRSNFSNEGHMSFGLATTNRGFGIADYTNSSMTSLNKVSEYNPGPTRWEAIMFAVDPFDITNSSILSEGVLFGPYGNDFIEVSGILSCTTTLSDVVRSVFDSILLVSYSMINGSITVNNWTAMNSSASYAFISNLLEISSAGWVQLQHGLQNSISTANTSDDITSGWASNYDQTILAQGILILLGRPPLHVEQRIATQVTRIPRAPFIMLISLALFYSALGTCLMIAALIAVRKGQGVEDVQARLSTLAVVAESFESPVWSDDARDVDMLFAERRGEPTRRIALARRQDGGRRFKQIVIRRHYMKNPCPPAASGNEDTCVQSSSDAAYGQAEK
ncbi:MAG: hypothetical protein Q9171_004152 [Xanthocarpia ochracea]